WQHYYSTPLTF
nr:immunoglobulin light chain junction region [Macaca mulatta]